MNSVVQGCTQEQPDTGSNLKLLLLLKDHHKKAAKIQKTQADGLLKK